MSDVSGALDHAFIKAIGHPLRRRLLVAFTEREASPVQLARELGVPVGRVSHHVRTLLQVGAIELVRTEPRRGAVEHFYRARRRAWLDDDEWQRLPPEARRAIFGQDLQRIVTDVAEAAGHGGFEHPRTHVSFVPLELDEAALDELAELLVSTVRQALRLQREAQARRDGSHPASPPIATELAIVHFLRGGRPDG